MHNIAKVPIICPPYLSSLFFLTKIALHVLTIIQIPNAMSAIINIIQPNANTKPPAPHNININAVNNSASINKNVIMSLPPS